MSEKGVKLGPHGGVAARPLGCHKEKSQSSLVASGHLRSAVTQSSKTRLDLLKKKRPPTGAAGVTRPAAWLIFPPAQGRDAWVLLNIRTMTASGLPSS